MPELRYSADCQEIVTDVLAVQYRGLITDELTAALLEEFGREDADRVIDAVRRHIRNTTLSRSGEPVGKYPPSTADVLYHLQQIRVEEQRLAQERENSQRSAESDAAGARVLQRIGFPKLAGDWGRKRSAITQALRQDLRLDLMRWEDCEVLWAVHKAWADSCWVRPADGVGWEPSGHEMPLAQCLALGRRLVAERAGIPSEAAA